VLNVLFPDVARPSVSLSRLVLADADSFILPPLPAVDAVIDGRQSIGRLHWRVQGVLVRGTWPALGAA